MVYNFLSSSNGNTIKLFMWKRTTIAEILINEIICFVSNHFHSVVAANIVTAVSIFYEQDGLMKAKADL